MIDPISRHAILLLLAIFVVLPSIGCDDPPPASNKAASAPAKNKKKAHKPRPLLKLKDAPPEEAPARVLGHLEDMTRLLEPIVRVAKNDAGVETCREFGEELPDYLELVSPDFEAAAQQEIPDEQREAIKAAYKKLSVVVSRCLSGGVRTRSAVERLLVLIKPITQPGKDPG